MNALTFQQVTFTPIPNNDQQVWLRVPQIADALQYRQANRVIDIYNRHTDEFTSAMTRLVKLPDLHPQTAEAGQMREVRVFSLRGAHLLAMFARTPVAKDFRRWVLDVLDREVQTEMSALSLTEYEAANLYGLLSMIRVMWSAERMDPIIAALRALQSPLAARLHDMRAEPRFTVSLLRGLEQRCEPVYTKLTGPH